MWKRFCTLYVRVEFMKKNLNTHAFKMSDLRKKGKLVTMTLGIDIHLVTIYRKRNKLKRNFPITQHKHHL